MEEGEASNTLFFLLLPSSSCAYPPPDGVVPSPLSQSGRGPLADKKASVIAKKGRRKKKKCLTCCSHNNRSISSGGPSSGSRRRSIFWRRESYVRETDCDRIHIRGDCLDTFWERRRIISVRSQSFVRIREKNIARYTQKSKKESQINVRRMDRTRLRTLPNKICAQK